MFDTPRLSLTIKDKIMLRAAYMPFVTHGGLFIPTLKSYKLGDNLTLLVNLMSEPEQIQVSGQVVWITPTGAVGNRAAGIGVQFTEGHQAIRHKIETYLADSPEAERQTHTM
jgi:type IV pilus assembly protein PilZ